MRIRGERECANCGRQWSYYETNSVTCPDCGSIRSVGRDAERHHHTDAPADLDLTAARLLLDDQPIDEVAAAAEEATREYLLARGFLHGGDLRPLDAQYVAAVELRHAAAGIKRLTDPDEEALEYFYSLLSSADRGERPSADLVPDAVQWARGLTAARVVEDYRRDVADWLADHPDPAVRGVYDAIGQHGTRVGALDGDIPPREADRLIAATQEMGRYLTTGDEAALARAEDQVETLG